MNIPTKKEMRWFVSRLIDIREDTDITPNHVADIVFDLNEIIGQKSIFKITEEFNPKDKVTSMLNLIKDDNEFLASFHNFKKDNLNFEDSNNDFIVIKGYQTKLLKSYRKENIFADEKLFTLTVNTEGKTIISIYGENTNVPLESEDQRRFFYYLLKHPKKFLSYRSLFKEITKGRTHNFDYYSNLYPTTSQQNTFVSDTRYNLKRKLEPLCQKYDIDIDKVIEIKHKEGFTYNQ